MPQGPLGERIPFEGVLNCWNDDHDLPDLLLAVSRSGKTGRLHFSNPEGDKTLDLREGKVVFAESSSQDDGLGQYLLRTGEISLMDYTRVAKMVQPGKRLGTLLVEEHVLHEENLIPAVIGQVRAVILGLFRRTESWYRFKEEEIKEKESITLDLAVPELVLEGVNYVESWRRISKGVGNLDSVYQQAASLEHEWLASKLGDDVRELVSMLASPTSLAEICEHATLPDFEACRYLWAFRSLGWIDSVDATAQVAVTPSAPVTQPAEPAPTPVESPIQPEPEPMVAASPSFPEALIETQHSMDRPSPPAAQAPPAIPASLIETKISVTPPTAPDQVTTAPSVPPPSPPKIPEHLNQTQLSIDPPPPTPVQKPRPIPNELLHTQIFEEVPTTLSDSPPEPEIARSTGELMESILDGDSPAPPPSLTPERPVPVVPEPPAPSPPPTSHATTQFFDGPSALAPEPPPPAPPAPTTPPAAAASVPSAPETPSEPAEAPSGFEALAHADSLGPPSPPASPTPAPQGPLAPNPADVSTQPSAQPAPPADSGMASFSDLALSDVAVSGPPGEPPSPLPLDPDPIPLVEAEAVAPEPPHYVPDEPLLPRTHSVEITQESLIPPRRRNDDLDVEPEGRGPALGIEKK